MAAKTLQQKLIEIQAELKAPKSQFNKFGGYNYRNCEDILEAVKPLCAKHDVVPLLSDEIVMIGERYYVKSIAKITDGKDEITTTAFARESFDKKGMDESQITGSTSSYARKYALNGLFCIDDTKDADFMDNSQNKKATSTPPQTTKPKEKHVAGYDEFLKIQKEKNVPPVEITKFIAAEFKKPRVGMLDEFEMVAALKWIKNYGQDKEGKGFALYDNADQELEHENAGDRI
ncbi:ERF family protein [Veillonella parvula]|uniref:ERF family protein n=1 Tax=Veillonella parvula TaxID=29466 RepID=UPI00241C93EE|nr:ERF family protein [Veillonella parvula]MBS5152154.1 ERF family protein [Veillonella parvula]